MSIIKILLLLTILTLSPLTHALEEALGTPTTVAASPLAVPIAQADPATLLEAALQQKTMAILNNNCFPVTLKISSLS